MYQSSPKSSLNRRVRWGPRGPRRRTRALGLSRMVSAKFGSITQIFGFSISISLNQNLKLNILLNRFFYSLDSCRRWMACTGFRKKWEEQIWAKTHSEGFPHIRPCLHVNPYFRWWKSIVPMNLAFVTRQDPEALEVLRFNCFNIAV